jgi:hypothetical protein
MRPARILIYGLTRFLAHADCEPTQPTLIPSSELGAFVDVQNIGVSRSLDCSTGTANLYLLDMD